MDSIATAYVSIRPNLDGFREELESGLEAAMADVGDRTVRINADIADATAKVDGFRDDLDDLGDKTATPDVQLATTEAQAELFELRDSLDSLGDDTVTPKVRVDDASAQLSLLELRAEMDELATRAATIKIGTSGQARKDITDIQAAIDAIGNETLRPHVDDSDLQRLHGDLQGLDTLLQNVGGDADRASTSLGGSSGGSSGSGLGGKVGLLQLLAPLIPALGTVGVVGAGGLAAIAGAAAAATIGFGAFALAAEGDLAGVKVQAEGLLTSWQSTTSVFTEPVIQDAVGLLPGVFRLLTPSVATASTAFIGLENNMSAALGSPFLTRFSSFIAGEGGTAITDFGHLISGLGHAFAGFAEGFSPEISSIDGDLNRWGADLAKWGNEAANGGFSSFLNYIQSNGPLVAHTFETLGSSFITIAKDAAPLGPVVLKIVDAAAGLLNDLLSLNPTLTTFAVGMAGVALSANKLLDVLGVGGLAGAAKSLPGLFSGIGDAATLGATGVYSVATAAGVGGGALELLTGAGTALEGGLVGVVYGVLNAVGAFQSFDAGATAAGKSWSENFVNSLGSGTNKVAAVQSQIASTQATLTALGNATNATSILASSGLSTYRQELQLTLAQLGPLGQTIIAAGVAPTTKLTDAFEQLSDKTATAQGQLKGLQGILPGLTTAQDAQNAAIQAADTALGSAAGYTGAYANSFGALTSQLQTANTALGQTTSLLNTLEGSTLNAEQANTAFQAAVRTLTDSLKTNGTSMDASTVKGLANRQAMDGVAGAILTVIQNMEKQGATSDQVVAKTSALTGYVIAMGAQYHLTAAQVTAFLTQVGLTPAQVRSELIASGYAQAAGTVLSLNQQIAAIPKVTNIQINEYLNTIGSLQTQSKTQHFATGTSSASGGLAMVAEAGPEAVIMPGGPVAVVKNKSVLNLPTGTQVLTAADTRKAMPGFATGTGNLSFSAPQPVAVVLNDNRTVTVGDIASMAQVTAALDSDRATTIATLTQMFGTG